VAVGVDVGVALAVGAGVDVGTGVGVDVGLIMAGLLLPPLQPAKAPRPAIITSHTMTEPRILRRLLAREICLLLNIRCLVPIICDVKPISNVNPANTRT
jgi:hypothetical protein